MLLKSVESIKVLYTSFSNCKHLRDYFCVLVSDRRSTLRLLVEALTSRCSFKNLSIWESIWADILSNAVGAGYRRRKMGAGRNLPWIKFPSLSHIEYPPVLYRLLFHL